MVEGKIPARSHIECIDNAEESKDVSHVINLTDSSMISIGHTEEMFPDFSGQAPHAPPRPDDIIAINKNKMKIGRSKKN